MSGPVGATLVPLRLKSVMTARDVDAEATTTGSPGGFTAGDPVRILPASDGSNLVGADALWSYAGPTRHPYSCVVRESDHDTTVHVALSRVVAREAGRAGE